MENGCLLSLCGSSPWQPWENRLAALEHTQRQAFLACPAYTPHGHFALLCQPCGPRNAAAYCPVRLSLAGSHWRSARALRARIASGWTYPGWRLRRAAAFDHACPGRWGQPSMSTIAQLRGARSPRATAFCPTPCGRSGPHRPLATAVWFPGTARWWRPGAAGSGRSGLEHWGSLRP